MQQTIKLKGRSSPEKRRPSMFWLFGPIVNNIWRLFTKYRITPGSKLPATGPFIVASNHFSEVDPLVVAVGVYRLGRLPRFMAKASLFRVPMLGWVLRSSGQIPVERNRGQRSSSNPIAAAQQVIQNQSGIIIYPEGTLTRDPSLWPMRGKSGAIRIALEHKIPIYPMAHWGAQQIKGRYSKGLSLFPRKQLALAVGDPLDLSEFESKKLTQQVLADATDKLMAEITRLVAKLRGEKAPETRWDPAATGQAETGRF